MAPRAPSVGHRHLGAARALPHAAAAARVEGPVTGYVGRMRTPSPASQLLLCLTLGCADHAGDSAPSAACVPPMSVVADIDETLTVSDGEWISQLSDPTHDPALRPDADALLRAYADLGYRVVYITARGEDIALTDGRTARQATEDWLVAHGFPLQPGDLFLAEGYGAVGDTAVAYKSGVLAGLRAADQPAEWAYGNADTDTLAWQQGGVANDHIFLVGERAGTMGVVGVTDDEAYTTHMASQLPAVQPTLCAR